MGGYCKGVSRNFLREGLVRIQRGVLVDKTPTLFGNFFQFARVFKTKIPKSPLNFPFHTKIFQNPSHEKFLDTSLGRGFDFFGFVTLLLKNPSKLNNKSQKGGGFDAQNPILKTPLIYCIQVCFRYGLYVG